MSKKELVIKIENPLTNGEKDKLRNLLEGPDGELIRRAVKVQLVASILVGNISSDDFRRGFVHCMYMLQSDNALYAVEQSEGDDVNDVVYMDIEDE